MVVPMEGMPVTVGIDGALVAAGALVGVEAGGVLALPPQAERSSIPTILSMVSRLNFRWVKRLVIIVNPFVYFIEQHPVHV